MVLEFCHVFQNHPNFFVIILLAKKRQKEVNKLSAIPKSNVSYDAIKKNQTLFGCLGKDCNETEEENEEELVD